MLAVAGLLREKLLKFLIVFTVLFGIAQGQLFAYGDLTLRDQIMQTLEQIPSTSRLRLVVDTFLDKIQGQEFGSLYTLNDQGGLLDIDTKRNQNFGLIDSFSQRQFYRFLDKAYGVGHRERIQNPNTKNFVTLINLMKQFIQEKVASSDQQQYLLVSFAVAVTGSVLNWDLIPGRMLQILTFRSKHLTAERILNEAFLCQASGKSSTSFMCLDYVTVLLFVLGEFGIHNVERQASWLGVMNPFLSSAVKGGSILNFPSFISHHWAVVKLGGKYWILEPLRKTRLGRGFNPVEFLKSRRVPVGNHIVSLSVISILGFWYRDPLLDYIGW